MSCKVFGKGQIPLAAERLAHCLALDKRPPTIEWAWAGPTLRPFFPTLGETVDSTPRHGQSGRFSHINHLLPPL
jgi:hypothetical protein